MFDIHGATLFTRRCLAEGLTECGELHLEDARRIGRQILRENALALFASREE